MLWILNFLKRLWIFICELGPSGGLFLFEKIVEETNPEIQEANEEPGKKFEIEPWENF